MYPQKQNAVAYRTEIAEMGRKFLVTGVPMMLALYTNTSVNRMYGTIIIALSAMVYSGDDAYHEPADRYLMVPVQYVIFVVKF